MIYKEMSTLESGGILQGSYLLCNFYIIYYYSLMDLEIPVFSNLQINDVVFTVVIFTPGFTQTFIFQHVFAEMRSETVPCFFDIQFHFCETEFQSYLIHFAPFSYKIFL